MGIMKGILVSGAIGIILMIAVSYVQQRAAACDGTPNCTFETGRTIPQATR
jgi:hypothetical protein